MSEFVSLDRVRAALRQERDRCLAIIEACRAAGRMPVAGQFITSGRAVHEVQAELAKPRTDVLRPTVNRQEQCKQHARAGFDPAHILAELRKPAALT